MTLPINYKLPELNKNASPEETTSYIHDLTFELQNMYQTMAQNVNGFYRNNDFVDGSAWIPTIRGSTTAGTISYNQQSGWAIRSGIITEVWFQIGWGSIGGGTGLLFLDLPYKVTKYDKDRGNLFIGPAISGGSPGSLLTGLVYPTNRTFITTVGLPETFFAKLEAGASGLPSAPVAIQADSYIAGSLRYIGVEDE